MNSPYRAHPALLSATPATGNTIPFPAGGASLTHGKPPLHRPPAPPAKSDGASKLVALVKLEGDIRQQKSAVALAHHAVNDARALAGFRQGWFFRLNRRNRFVLEAVSDVPSVDLNAPLVLAVTQLMNGLAVTKGAQGVALGGLPGQQFPHGHGFVVPLLDRRGKAFAALLLAREGAWTEADQSIAKRISETYAHALCAMTPPGLLRRPAVPHWIMVTALAAVAALAFLPVPMTALAPFEVVAFEPAIIAAPMDGVITRVTAEANRAVQAGEVLFTLDDTRQKAELAIATQKVLVAESRLATARNGAFNNADLKRSLATAEKELQLAQAEQSYAQSLLSRGQVRAPRDGLLIYSAKSEWIGKPVRTGERVMEIADPARVAYRLDLAVQDAIVLGESPLVWLFMDADPLHPRAAQISSMSYHAREVPGGALAYVIMARPADQREAARIGLRGTAQLSGEKVALGFYLLRRPIAALRQYFGR
jgi:multidrug resistance efflux pump